MCVEAGLSLDHGLLRVARELKDAQPALSEELSLTWAEISILPSRDQALANLAARVDLPSVRSVVSTLAQSLRFGSPLAHSLRNAAEEMRHEQLMQLEERANRLPGADDGAGHAVHHADDFFDCRRTGRAAPHGHFQSS